LIPIGILVFIALPSLRLLNEIESDLPFNTVKLVRNQWNWQREQKGSSVDHFLDGRKLDELRGYERPLLLPAFTKTRIILTRRDVLHSLGMPSLGIKIDSTPGRLRAVSVQPYIFNLIVGSCYELCGRGHSAMPIFFLVRK
jgi:cytochrome c oxidase subunit 2